MSALVAGKMKNSMSQARKVFRFMRSMKFLLIFSHIMSFFYYIHDNILWGLNIGILRQNFLFFQFFKNFIKSDVISEKNQIICKNRKNIFSLIKVCLNMLKSVLFFIRRKQKENHMEMFLHQCPKGVISYDEKTFDICQALLRQRKKRRLEALELFLSIFRGITLIKKLKITRFLFKFLKKFMFIFSVWTKFLCLFVDWSRLQLV